MGWNFKDGNFPGRGGRDSPGGSLIGGNFPDGNFPGGSFPDTNKKHTGKLII